MSTTHGLTGTRVYATWANMKQRCSNPKHPDSHTYSERGIEVCTEWLQFDSFWRWASQNGYTDELMLDRIDNEKGYCPANCRWVTPKQSRFNQRAPREGQFIGAHRGKSGWEARYGQTHLGTYRTPEEAARVRDAYARARPGDLATLNFPDEDIEPLKNVPKPLPATNSSGFLGVHSHHGKWQARATHEGKRHCIGCFPTPEEAHEAREKFLASI